MDTQLQAIEAQAEHIKEDALYGEVTPDEVQELIDSITKLRALCSRIKYIEI